MNNKNSKTKSALHLMDGVEQPPQLNPRIEKQKKVTSQSSIDELFDGLLHGDRVKLGKAITLVESNLPAHQDDAARLVERCLSYSGNSIRIGVTGVPGVGKSTFIEALGMHLISQGNKIAVLAIDPSSERSKGSILGDKTRMEQLSAQEMAFIRPSPSAGTLGGVTRKTRETILLCEAAGHNVIFVETVGVGQSETAVKSMTDFFCLLMLAGAGDELQGIKRGIMEMADAVLINKADGDNVNKAKSMIPTYQNALHFFPSSESGWSAKVLDCSSINGYNIDVVWEMILEYKALTTNNGYFEQNRRNQEVSRLHLSVNEYLQRSFYSDPLVLQSIADYENQIAQMKISPYQAARMLIEKYRSK